MTLNSKSFKKGQNNPRSAVHRVGDYVEVKEKRNTRLGEIGEVVNVHLHTNGKGYRSYAVVFSDGEAREMKSASLQKINPLYAYLANGDFDAEAPTAEPKNLTYGQLSDFNLPLSEHDYGHDWGREAIEPRDFHLDH